MKIETDLETKTYTIADLTYDEAMLVYTSLCTAIAEDEQLLGDKMLNAQYRERIEQQRKVRVGAVDGLGDLLFRDAKNKIPGEGIRN